MSDTPRTDSVYWTDSEAECEVVSREFAEQLERELTEARAEAEDYKDRWMKCVKVQSDYRSGRLAKQTKAEFRKLRKQVQVLTEMVQQLVKERQ